MTTTYERAALRRGTAADWTLINPTLADGEEGYERDTGRRKVGDGATAWVDLSYDFAQRLIDASGNLTATNITNGSLNCTSITRPASPRTGQIIYETDTKSAYEYDGTAWRRLRYGGDVDNVTVAGTFSPAFSTAGTWVTTGDNGRYRVENGIVHAWAFATYASGGFTTGQPLDCYAGLPESVGIEIGTLGGHDGQIVGHGSLAGFGTFLLQRQGGITAGFRAIGTNGNDYVPTFSGTPHVSYQVSYPIK